MWVNIEAQMPKGKQPFLCYNYTTEIIVYQVNNY